ncbi:MAG: glycosyltransferase family 2 protein [Acidimicrobiia bacterium]
MTLCHLGIIVPMFNEVAGVRRCITAIAAGVDAVDAATTLIVVDDGSTDGTASELDKIAREIPTLNVVHHQTNQGYGAALRTGAGAAAERGCDWVLFMDSDLTNPPDDIRRFAAALGDDVDLVKACRWAAGGRAEGIPLRRVIPSRFGNKIASLCFGSKHHDLTNGFRAIRARDFAAMPLRERGFPVIMEECYWAWRRDLRFRELPTVLTSRTAEQRSSLFGYSLTTIRGYLRYPLRAAAERARIIRPVPEHAATSA